MKIDLNVAIVDLADVPIKEPGQTEPMTCGRVLATHLISGSKGDAIKFHDWARSLYKGNSIEVDNSDFKTIRSFTSESDQINVLAKAQILNTLDECEKRSKIKPVSVMPVKTEAADITEKEECVKAN